jgi:hypothetical protein
MVILHENLLLLGTAKPLLWILLLLLLLELHELLGVITHEIALVRVEALLLIVEVLEIHELLAHHILHVLDVAHHLGILVGAHHLAALVWTKPSGLSLEVEVAVIASELHGCHVHRLEVRLEVLESAHVGTHVLLHLHVLVELIHIHRLLLHILLGLRPLLVLLVLHCGLRRLRGLGLSLCLLIH